jgi:hypothetical protein
LSVIVGLIVLAGLSFAVAVEGFEGGNDALEGVLDAPVVVGEAMLAVALGELEELGVVLGVLAVGGQELDGGLELRAGQTGVWMGTFLLRRSPAVAVGKAGLDAGEVVLEPLGVSRGRLGVIGEHASGDVDALFLEAVEGDADGGVVQPLWGTRISEL